MAIDKGHEVDFIGIDKVTDRVVLSIVDEMDWNDEQVHLMRLQEKINTYVSFIESGEVLSVYPISKGHHFEIHIFINHRPTQTGLDFLNKVDVILGNAGFGFSWTYIPA